MKKMMIFMFTVLSGYAGIQAAATSGRSRTATQSSYDIAPYLAAAAYVMQGKDVYLRGTTSFFNHDQCTFILADDTIGDGQQKLYDQCKALPAGNTDADVHAILQSVSSPTTDALMFVARREHLFLGVKGPHSRILVTKIEGSNVNYSQENVTMATKKMIRTSTIQSIAFLRGINLSDETVAEIIKPLIRTDKTALDIATAIVQTDGGKDAAVGFFNGFLWSEAYQRIRYNAEDISVLHTEFCQHESSDQERQKQGTEQQGCCQMM